MPLPVPIRCQELVELVTDYFDGALDAPRRDQFEAHVIGCPDCRRYVQQMRITLRVACDLDALERAPRVARLLDAFRDWHRTGSS